MTQRRRVAEFPRIPLKGSIDLTYRCNNSCRHCWLREPENSLVRDAELTADEIRRVVDQARALGTRSWTISGGEPMLRPDFGEIFDYVAEKSVNYSLNTNGTLVTPAIAQLLRRPGDKMVSVYGATPDVYDRVTRNPGGFEALLQGLSYLKEAGVGFTMQLIPIRDNWDQWDEMISFARSWSDSYRVGASWLHKSACQDDSRNAEVDRQRLEPRIVIELDRPDMAHDPNDAADAPATPDDRLHAGCIATRREFHVDPYGTMSFCPFVKDPELRFNLRTGSLQEAWEEFIPSLAEVARGGQEYLEGCAVCDLRNDCRWCDVYGYLEHGRHGAKVEYLCQVARENREFRTRWAEQHRRYFEIAGITIRVDSDVPFAHDTMDAKFESFFVDAPGADLVVLNHHFGGLPARVSEDAREVYRKAPWAIYRHGTSWIYEVIVDGPDGPVAQSMAVFSDDHSNAVIYSPPEWEVAWRKGGLGSLTLFPTDQILVARLLADRSGCLLHSGAVTIDGQGLVFVGHSDAGKSTTMDMIRESLGERVTVLCDDRNIVRRWPEGFRVHGTWSHGDVPDVSAAPGPLRAILFLEQSPLNELELIVDRRDVTRHLLGTLIRPMVTADWWLKEMDVIERIAAEVPCYIMRFDRSGAIVGELEKLVR